MDLSSNTSSSPASGARGEARGSETPTHYHRLPEPLTLPSPHVVARPAAGGVSGTTTPTTGSPSATAGNRVSAYTAAAPTDVSLHTSSCPASTAAAATATAAAAAAATSRPPTAPSEHGRGAPPPLSSAHVAPAPSPASQPAAGVALQLRRLSACNTAATTAAPSSSSAVQRRVSAPAAAVSGPPPPPPPPTTTTWTTQDGGHPPVAANFPAVRYALSLLPTFGARSPPASYVRAAPGAAPAAAVNANTARPPTGGGGGDGGVPPSAVRYAGPGPMMGRHGAPHSATAPHRRREPVLTHRGLAPEPSSRYAAAMTAAPSGSPVRPAPELQYRRMDVGPTGWASMPFAASAASASTSPSPSSSSAAAAAAKPAASTTQPITGTVVSTVSDGAAEGNAETPSVQPRPPSAPRPAALAPRGRTVDTTAAPTAAAVGVGVPAIPVVALAATACERSPESGDPHGPLTSASDLALHASGSGPCVGAPPRGAVSSLMTSPMDVDGVFAGERKVAMTLTTPSSSRGSSVPPSLLAYTSPPVSSLEAALPATRHQLADVAAVAAAVPQSHTATTAAAPDMSAYGMSYTMPSVFGQYTPEPASSRDRRQCGRLDERAVACPRRSSSSSNSSSTLTPTTHRSFSASGSSVASLHSTLSADAVLPTHRVACAAGGPQTWPPAAVGGVSEADPVTGACRDSVAARAVISAPHGDAGREPARHHHHHHHHHHRSRGGGARGSVSHVDYWAPESRVVSPVVPRGPSLGRPSTAAAVPGAAHRSGAEGAGLEAAAGAAVGSGEGAGRGPRAPDTADAADAAVIAAAAAAKTAGANRSTWLDQLGATLYRDMLERRRAWGGLLLEIAIPLVCTACAVVLWAAFGDVTTLPPTMLSAIGGYGFDFTPGTYKQWVCYNDTWNGAANYIAGLYPCSYMNRELGATADCSSLDEDELPVKGLCYYQSGYVLDLFTGGMRAGLARVMPLDDIIMYQWLYKLLSWNESTVTSLLIGAGLASNTRFSALQSSGKLYFAPAANVPADMIATLRSESDFFQYVYNDTFDTVAEAHDVIKSGTRGSTWALVHVRRFDETGLDLSIELGSTAMPLLSTIIDKAYPGGTSYDRSDVYYTNGGPSLMQVVVQYYLASYVAAGVPPAELAALNLSASVAAPSRAARGVTQLDTVHRFDLTAREQLHGLADVGDRAEDHRPTRRTRPTSHVGESRSVKATAASGDGASTSAVIVNGRLSPSVLATHAALTSKAATSLYLGPMPFVPYVTNQVMTSAYSIVGFVIVLAFLYPVAQSTRRLVLEKERRVREAMQIMGLHSVYLWTSWFLHSVALMFTISFLMTMLMCTTLVRRSDAFCIFLVLFMFALTCVPLSGLLAAFFNTSRMAALMTPLIYFALAVPIFAMRSAAPSVYLGLSVFSPTCFAIILQGAFARESGDGFAQPIFTSPLDDPNTAALLGFLVMDLFVYVLLMFYLDAVLPKAVGASKHPLYFLLDPIQHCQRRAGARAWRSELTPPQPPPSSSTPSTPSASPSPAREENSGGGGVGGVGAAGTAGTAAARSGGWTSCCGGACGKRNAAADNDADDEEAAGLCEGADGRDPHGVYETETFAPDQLAVRMVGLRKSFTRGGRRFTAVRNLTWQMPRVGISVLLGHNGAGKSTAMNMMTGMLYPDGGDCYICGHSIRYELDAARHEIGFCPQHNILWPELTCREHLEFFARIKGLRGAALEDAVAHTLKEVDLLAKEAEPSRALSGGMKRKLSVAIAFVGGSPLVFLDEPTAGMDVAARRHAWELLLRMSRSRSVLLTTHFMDEADLLGDRVAIMSRGQLKCSGSSLFLKSRLGVGYNISISVDPAVRVRRLDAFLQQHIPQAERLTSSGGEVDYRLPAKQLPRFPGLLNALDTIGPHLGIRGYAISPTTLEEIFLKIAHDAAAEDRRRRRAARERKREAAAEQRGRRGGCGGVWRRCAAWLCAGRPGRAHGGDSAEWDEEDAAAVVGGPDAARRRSSSGGWDDSDWGDETTDAGEWTLTSAFGEASAAPEADTHAAAAASVMPTVVAAPYPPPDHHDHHHDHHRPSTSALPPVDVFDARGDAATHGKRSSIPGMTPTDATQPRASDALRRGPQCPERLAADRGAAAAAREDGASSAAGSPTAARCDDAAAAAAAAAAGPATGPWWTTPSAVAREAGSGGDGLWGAEAAGCRTPSSTTAAAAAVAAPPEMRLSPASPVPWRDAPRAALPPHREAPVDVVWNCEIAFSAATATLLQTEAMMRKRFYNLKRDRKMLCFQIICPVVCVLIAMLLNLAQVYAVDSLPFNTTDYREETLMDTAGCAAYFDGNDPATAAALAPNLRMRDVNSASLSDFYDMLQDEWYVHGGIGRYGGIVCAEAVRAYVSTVSANPVVLLVNASSYHEFPIAMANFYNLLFKGVRGDSVGITVSAGVLPSATQPSSVDSIKLLLMGIIIMVPFTFLPSNCVAWVVKERECKSRHLQEICGLRYSIYWFSNFVFDFTAYLVTMLLVITIFAIFQRSEYVGTDTIGATFTLFLVFGFCSTATAYLLQFVFRTHSSAQSVVMAVGFISGFLLVIIVFVLNLMTSTAQASLTMRKVFRVFPTYAVGEGIVNLATLSQSQATDSSLTAFSMETIGWPCVYMSVEGPLFLALTLFIDHPYWRLKRRLRHYDADGDAATLSAAAAQRSAGHANKTEPNQQKSKKKKRAERAARSAPGNREDDLDDRDAAAAAAAASAPEKEDSDVEDERVEVRRRMAAYRTALQRRTSSMLMSDVLLSPAGSELHAMDSGELRDAAAEGDDGVDDVVPVPPPHGGAHIDHLHHRNHPHPHPHHGASDDAGDAAAALRMADAVDVVGLHKRYDSGKVAVHDLTFGVVPGEVFGFLGTNGAGKTTTMSILCQEFYPTAGRVYVCGYDIVEESRDALQCIGYCPQFDATLDLLTVEEHLRVFAGIRGIARAEQPRVVRALLQLTGLREYRDTTAAQLSGGNRRKLSVALSLVGGPQVVILDEPSAGMDPVARREMWTSIQAFKQRCSIILCTHHLEEVEALADCVAIMVDGRLRCIGSKVHLKQKYGSGFEMTIRVQPPSSVVEAATPAALSPSAPALGAPPPPHGGGVPDGSAEAAELEAIKARVVPFILNAFPSSKLMEVRGQRLVFSLPKDVHLSNVFEHVQAQREALCISDYTVSQTSIEQVFLRISEEAEEAERIRAALTERKRDKENAQRLRREQLRRKREKRKRKARREAVRADRRAAREEAAAAAAAAATADEHQRRWHRRRSSSNRPA